MIFGGYHHKYATDSSYTFDVIANEIYQNAESLKVADSFYQ